MEKGVLFQFLLSFLTARCVFSLLLRICHTVIYMLFTFGLLFYSAAAFLAIKSAVLATAIPSVHLSVCPSHAGTLSRRMKIGSRELHCDVAKHSSILIPTMIGDDVPFHLKFAL